MSESVLARGTEGYLAVSGEGCNDTLSKPPLSVHLYFINHLRYNGCAEEAQLFARCARCVRWYVKDLDRLFRGNNPEMLDRAEQVQEMLATYSLLNFSPLTGEY
jgi:hypothetical protein